MSCKTIPAAVIAGLWLWIPGALGADLRISIGVRETGTAALIGGDGGTTGPIEWVRLDGLILPLDGQFHTFAINFGTDPVTGFTGDGILNGTRGTLENVRIRNINGVSDPLRLFIDNIRNTTAGAVPQTVSDFEGFNPGLEVTFQDPRFSSSTSANLAVTPNVASTSTAAASQGTTSDNLQFRFIDADPSRWLRLTTFDATNLPNPAINFAAGSSLSFDMMGVVVPEPAAPALLAGIALLLTTLTRKKSTTQRTMH